MGELAFDELCSGPCRSGDRFARTVFTPLALTSEELRWQLPVCPALGWRPWAESDARGI